MPKPLLLALTLALAACDFSSGDSDTSLSSDAPQPNPVSITETSITDNQATVSWSASGPEPAEYWRLYQNNLLVCSANLDIDLSSSDANGDYQQSATCTLTLEEGENSVYVQLCNFSASGSSTCSASAVKQIFYEAADPTPGAVSWQDLPSSTSATSINVTWLKEAGGNGDYWFVYHNDAEACAGDLSYTEDYVAQSADCIVDLDEGVNQLQAELCYDQPAGIQDLCTQSEVASVTLVLDPTKELATPVLDALDESDHYAAVDININWHKDTSVGSAGEDWSLYRNGATVCEGQLAAEVDAATDAATSASCTIQLTTGDNTLQIELCTDVATYSGASCAQSNTLTVAALDPNPLDPGTLQITNVLPAETFDSTLPLNWSIASGNGVQHWSVDLNGAEHCITSSPSEYYESGSCQLNLAVGLNTISVSGCNYGYADRSACSTSTDLILERISLPGSAELTSSLPATTYDAEHSLSWVRSTGASAEYWFASVLSDFHDNQCNTELSAQTPQSDSCTIELSSGHNEVYVQTCVYNHNRSSSYCAESDSLFTELLAPIPATPELSTESQSIADDSIEIRWSKSSGANGSYWGAINNGGATTCSDQPVITAGDGQSGFCDLPLVVGENLVSVRLCADNVAGTASCAKSATISITRLVASPEFTSATSVAAEEGSTAVFYTAVVEDNDSSAEQISFALSGGDDVDFFRLDSASGALAFQAAVDYEVPQDSDADNVYQLDITATDELGNSAQLELAVSLSNINDNPPALTSPPPTLATAENDSSIIYTFTASDLDGDALSYSLDGADAQHFTLGTTSGALQFDNAPDYETPLDANQDNVYELAISVADGDYQSTEQLSVAVSDSNDETPQATSASSIALALDSLVVGATVYTVTAIDTDADDQITYTLGGVDQQHFVLNASSGELAFSQLPSSIDNPQDADGDNIYEVIITLTDLGGNSSDLALSVSVVAVIGNAPEFSQATASVDFDENAVAAVYTASATDADGDALTYSIAGDDAEHFAIDATSGVIEFNVAPDHEQPTDSGFDNVYNLIIAAEDPLGNQAQQSLTVSINDLNDNAPQFASSTAALDASENTTTITTIVATDADSAAEHSTLTYSLDGGSDLSLFTIDPASGALAFNQAPDYEHPHDSDLDNIYNVSIVATDSVYTASQDLTVTITNVNEAPAFTETSVALATAENNSSFTHTVAAAIDPDQDQTLAYQLSGDDQSAFTLDPDTRALTFITTPNYESAKDQNSDNTYQITITATDGEYSASQSIVIAVSDYNDEAPQFTSSNVQAVDYTTVQVGDIIYTAQATDADAGDQIAYALGGADGGYFTFDSSSGALAFYYLPALEDFPEGGGIAYDLAITATDLADNKTTFDLVVNLLDDTGSPPEFASASVSIAVDENTASSVYTAQATDVDAGDTLSYSISGTDRQLFSIDATSGALSFNQAPDYEQPTDADADNEYHLIITATDSPVGNQAQQSLAITVKNINDNSPQFALSSSTFAILENTTAITTIAATDLDGDTLTYTLTTTTDANLFTLDPASGALSFNASPDYEQPTDQDADNTYELTLSVFDGANTSTQAITVSVANIDEAPTFAAANQDLPVNENSSGAVYQAQATDPEQAPLTYSASGTDASLFTLDATSGDLSFNTPPDYEAPLDANADNVYQLTLTASDGANQASQDLVITIADVNEAPSFASASVETSSVENNANFAYSVAAASDVDQDPLTYYLDGADSADFDLDASTRVLRFVANPDYENPTDADGDNVYQLSVVASDGALEASQVITIAVADLNDEAPQFTSPSSQTVNYTSAQVGAVIYTASATDADANDQIAYALSGADASAFSFSTSSGALAFAQLPSLNELQSAGGSIVYQLLVVATDLGANSSELDLSVSLLDDTGNVPEFASASASVSVDENIATTIYTAQATDADGDTLSYSISGTDSSHFTLDSTSGALAFISPPDHEQPTDSDGNNVYDLIIIATDSPVGNQAQQSLTVSVKNLNDNSPQFELSSSTFAIPENSTAITTVAAADADGDDLTLALITSADSSLFTLDPASGALAFISAPDFESPQDNDADNTYELELSVGDGINTSTQAITVSVANIDEAPSFAAATVDLPINENTSGAVYQAQASDPEGTSLTYSASGADASLFTLDSTSGELAFKQSPNYEQALDSDADNVYQLDITAADGTNQTSQALTISITDVNEAPAFASASVDLDVDENAVSFTHIVDAAVDEDSGEQLAYVLSGADQSAFDFDAATRALSFKQSPNFEQPTDQNTDNVYQISITASDADYSTTQAIAIAVADLNDEAPQFTSATSLALDYTSVVVGAIVYSAQATDADLGDQITYALSGADASNFSFDSSSGALAFSELPSLENPKDANTDNVYQLSIAATDLGANSTDLALSINVVDDTGSAPTFTQASASITVDENTASVIYTAQASDVDPGDTLTYSISGTDSSLFTIGSSSGELAFISPPDHEQPADSGTDNIYDLAITATDSIGKQAQQSLTISVNNLNDNSPQFNLNSSAFSTPENSTAVANIAAADADGDELTFALITTTDANHFTIDPSSGALAFTSVPDFETPQDSNADNTYELELSVFDGSHTTTQSISVTVTNIDEAPSFAAATQDLSINENTSGSIYTAQATDPEGAALTYSASGADAGLFTINNTSGDLSFNSSPNFETPLDSDTNNVYQLDITTTDGANQVSQSISISITDVNEAPAFASASVNLDVDENAAGFTHTVDAATDPDQGETLTYQLGGDDAAAFDFDSATRALSFKQSPNYESPQDQDSNNVYQITITAADSQYSTNQAIAIAVADLNDEAPQFTSATSLALDFTSVFVGAIVYTAQATDADLGDQITYALSGADASHFSFDSSSGALAFSELPSLENPKDANTDNVYQLSITATDLGANSTDLALSINVVDDTGSAPTFDQANVSINVDENSASTVYTAQASDVDPGDTLTYSISGTDSSLFTIGSSSGELSFNTAPDYENPSDSGGDNIYNLTITVTDSVGKQAQQSLTISVNNLNDNAPQFTLASSAFSTPENSTAVATITAADPDGDDLTFSLTTTTDSSFFTLDPASGALSFNQAPDFETPQDSNADNTYELELSVADGSHTTTQEITITVTNVDEAPSFAAATVDLPINENTSGSLYQAQASDPEGATLAYSASGTDAGLFDLDSASGELTFKQSPNFENPLDSDSNNVYQLSISASDGANQTSQAVTVTVADVNEAPAFTSASVNLDVDENAASFAHTVDAATDPDQGEQLTYQLGGDDAAAFNFDAATRALSFKQSPNFEQPTDQNTDNVYQIDIIASDGEYDTTQSIAIAVTDLNDEAPQFTSATSLALDYTGVAVDVTVYTAQATDADANDQITYALSGADASAFTLDSSSGALAFAQAPSLENPKDADKDNVYQLTITATDLNANSTDLALSVNVVDDTGSAPTFTSASASINVDENSPGSIYTAQASDVDPGDILTYSISGTDSSHFTIDPSSGELSFNQAPDFENPTDNGKDNTYDLSITATDAIGKQASQSLAIAVNNLNDNPPQFALASSTFSTPENTTAVTTITANDPDGDDLSFALTSTTDSSHFTIDPASGALSFNQAPDFETPQDANADNTYDLELSVADVAYTTSATISVSVTNVNDVAPSFAAATDSSSVSENTSGVVYTASATDIEGDTPTYSLAGTDSAHFTIDLNSGELSLTNALDFENPTDHNSNNDYELEITASDGTNSAALTLTVSVQDLNDNSPSFGSASDSIQVPENTSGTVYTTAATDLDATDTITYSLSGTDSALLQIGSSSGALAFINSPDYENPQDQGADNFYELSIIASDGANSVSLALSIEILDTSERPPEITQLIGGDQAIDFTFDDFGTSKQLSIYRFTDDACSTAELASDHTQCYASDDTSSDTAKIDFSGALSSADYQVNDSGLRAGQRYYYQIWAAESSSASDIGVWSVRYSAMTWPAADVGTTLGYDASATTGTQVVLSFTAPSSGDDDYYHFLRHSDPDCASYGAGTALNRADYSDWSALADPVNGGLCSGLTELSLSGANLHAPSGGASDSHTDSGLAEGTTYYYLLRTVNYSGANGVDFTTRSGASATSNQLQWTTVPPAPAADDLEILSSPAIAADQISIAFAAVAGASNYKLVRYIPANCSVADQQISSVEGCSGSTGYAEQDFSAAQSVYTDSGLQVGSTYAYQYRALNAAGSSQYSPAVSATTTFDKPSISLTSSVSLADANVISVSWSASSGIDSYSVLGSSNESCLISATASADPQASAANCDHSISASAASSATSIDIDQLDDGSALASGSYYYFAAAAVSSSGSSDYSDVASAITAPASPNVISLSPGYQQVEVAWDVPAGSAENVLYRYTESTCSLSSFPSNCGLDTGSYTFTSSIPNDAYIDDNSGNGLVDNQMYYYALQASNAGGARYTESASVPVVLTAPKTPDSLIASGERLAVQLRWGSSPTDADDGVAGYEILRSSSSTCYGSAISAYSDYASCPDAALFLFDYGSGEDQNEYQFSDSELDPSSGSEPLTGGTTYYYWIRSFYGSASDAVYSASTSAPASATPILPAPTNLTVDAEQSASGASTDISIAWDEVATASGYVLYRTTSADCLTITNRNTSEAQTNCADYQREELSGSSTTATTHSSLPSDTIYYYYVAAANSAVEGELSSVLSTRSATVAPTITSTQTYSNTVVRVEWDASSAYDATYHLYAYSGDSSCNPFTTECPHESLTTFTADGSSDYYNYAQQLEPGTHYNFKMLAITEYEQEDGTEDFVHGAISSAAATATTAANHPTITGHEYVDYNYFDLFVSIEGGLDSVVYYVLYTLDANCSVNDVLGNQCALGGALGTAEPASSIRLANYDFGVYYYVLSLNSEDYSLLSPDEDTPPYLVPARPAQVELSVNATKNSSGNGSDVKIEWQQSSGVDGYVLYRTTSSGCITDANRNDSSTKSNCDDYQRQEISGSSTTTTTHSNLPNDTIYHYSLATISNGSEGSLSESIATHTATTAPPIVDVITYNESQIEVTWWATSAFETDYYIYAYSGDASCDPHAEVCPGEKLVSVAFDFSAEYTTVFTGLTPGTRYNFKAYSNVAYPQENGGTDYIVGYISESAKTNYTFANHPTITGHQENDDGDILLEFAIDGGTDDLTYYIFRTTNGDCTITEVYNADSECTDRGTATATPEQNVVIHKVDDNDYYYHVISANPVGPLAWDDSTEPYYIPSYVVVKDIDVEMTHLVANSNSDFITINFVAAEPIPADNKWTVRFYPALIENSEVREHVFTDEQVTEDLALAFQINAKYYFHPHRFELYASRLDDTDFILLASFIVWDVQPPPLVAVEKNADSNKYSEEKDFDIYIQNYNGDFDVSSVVGIETLEADITMIFTDADAALCRPPLVPIVDMIYGNCPLVRSYTDWWDGSELLFNRVEGDTGNQLLHDVVVSNNESYQASQGLFQVYDITFAGTTPIYEDQDDPWSFFVGPYISSFTIDTDFGKYSLDYEEAFSYLSIELAFEEDDMAEFKVYGSSSSASLLPTPTLVLSPALLSQGLSAGSAYNSWDLHLLWEAINGINSYAIHEYSDSDCAYLLSAPELCGNYNLHSSLSPDFSHAFAAADMGSYFYYRLQAYDAAGNSSELGEQIAVHIPQALNDSGLATCVVADALSGAQDCASGRDASVDASAKVGSGSAGFDFSLLEPDTNSDSHCVHDNTTGLSWSSWSVPADDLASAAEPDSESNATRSSATFAELATISLDACGYSDWSLPSIHELLSIADYNQTDARIDRNIFTDFNSSQPSYWSASGHILDFSSGDISLEANASAAHSVLLVRGDRRWGHDFGAERFQLVEHTEGNTSIHLVYDNHSQLHYAPCLAGQSYDPVNHSCTGTPTELDYIDSLNAYDSNSTWRQPNIKELIAILDPTNHLLPNPTYFPNPTSNSTSDSNSSTNPDSTSDPSTNSDSSTGSGSTANSSTDSDSSASDSSTDSSSDYSSDIDSDLPYPAPIFILTPSSQSADHITGRQLNPTTQSTTPTPITQLLNSHLIYQPLNNTSTSE